MLRQQARLGAVVFFAALSVRSVTAQDATQFRDMPYRIITRNGDKVVDELFFDQILINPEIAKNDFKR